MNVHKLEVFKKVNNIFPCRRNILKLLLFLLNGDSLPSVLFVYGHSGTGKSTVIKELLQQENASACLTPVFFNCVEYCTNKSLLQSIIDELVGDEPGTAAQSIDNLYDFMNAMRSLETARSYVLVFDNADRLRDMDDNILLVLLRLQRLSNLNVCVVIISQLPYEKYFSKSGAIDVVPIYFPQYTKSEALEILNKGYKQAKRSVYASVRRTSSNNAINLRHHLSSIEEHVTPELYKGYLNLLLSVFYKACRDVPELKTTTLKYFVVYVQPIVEGTVRANDIAGLWRLVAQPLKEALAQVYMRFDQPQRINAESASEECRLWDYARSLELPYYGKYLLIAAFLASYNSPKSDKRIFVKNAAKQRKTTQSIKARAKQQEKQTTTLGPKSFKVDRLLAIFYAILDERVGLTCNLLSQISTLVHLKVLSFVSGENNVMESTSRLQCTVSLEFVVYIGKLVGFNVQQYLCDFL